MHRNAPCGMASIDMWDGVCVAVEIGGRRGWPAGSRRRDGRGQVKGRATATQPSLSTMHQPPLRPGPGPPGSSLDAMSRSVSAIALTVAVAAVMGVGAAPGGNALRATASVSPSTPSSAASQSTPLSAASPSTSSSAASQSTPSTPSSTAVAASLVPVTCVKRSDVAAWPLRDRAANLVMIGVPIAQIDEAIAVVRTEGLGGILVRGIPTKAAGPKLRLLRDAGRHGPTLVTVDEEGGRVQHLRIAVGVLPSARRASKTLTTAQYRSAVAAHGRGMRALGFTMNLAPDIDLDPTGGTGSAAGTNGIGDRSYGRDPAVVAAYGRAFALGMLDAGIVPVLKHFPGHGNANGDSHNIGAFTPPFGPMRAADMVPFASILTDSRVGVMSAHLYVPGLDTFPASLSSRALTQLLRGELGHRGLIVTDSLSMWPIRYYYRAGDAAVLALRAGNDVLLFDDRPSVQAILDGLVAAMTKDEALAEQAIDANLRVLAAKGRALCDAPTPTPSTVVRDNGAVPGAPATTVPVTIPLSTTPPGPASVVRDWDPRLRSSVG